MTIFFISHKPMTILNLFVAEKGEIISQFKAKPTDLDLFMISSIWKKSLDSSEEK